MRTTEAVDEARHLLEICNACRYCEGFCAVFPAMELRRDFTNEDVGYLANLCHNCKGCYHACQYAPPHPWGINLPKTFAEVRQETYEEYAWPPRLARVFHHNGAVVSLVVAAGIAFALLLTALFRSAAILFGAQTGPGAFYAVIPWGIMVLFAGVSFVFSLVALAYGARAFWRDIGNGPVTRRLSIFRAIHDIMTLRNLGGGGDGCNDVDEAFSKTRRRFHHAMFYGFLLCFASTVVATYYSHFLGLDAPYPFFSLPVLLGTLGGLGMVVGAGGLIWIKMVTDPAPVARRLLGGDYAFLAMLLLAAATGLLLLSLRATSAMGTLLAVHLGIILALFLLLPYSKMVHGLYRSAALLRAAVERHPAKAK